MTEKLIRNENEAIDVLKKNKPTSGYYMLQESVEMAIQALEEIQQYRAIGTMEEFKELKEKTIAKKVISRNSIYRCPTCESLVSVTQTKCTKCSQKLDWE